MKNSSYLCTQQAHPASRQISALKQIQSFANQIGIIFQSVATILDNA